MKEGVQGQSEVPLCPGGQVTWETAFGDGDEERTQYPEADPKHTVLLLLFSGYSSTERIQCRQNWVGEGKPALSGKELGFVGE